jgi:hypothetical protein
MCAFQDPTAGGLSSDISVWFLDETSLQENINKTLHRFCQPTPQVVGYDKDLFFENDYRYSLFSEM